MIYRAPIVILLLIALLTFFISPQHKTFAGDIHDKNKHKLTNIQEEIKTAKQAQKKLDGQKRDLEEALDDINSKLINLSGRIQSHEKNAQTINLTLKELNEEEHALDQNLNARKSEINKLLTALIRLKRTPAEVMVLQPQGILSAARGSMVMGNAIPEIQDRLSKLVDDINKLNAVKEDIQKQKLENEQVKQRLSVDHNTLEELASQRKTAIYNTNKTILHHQLTINKLAREAKSIEELLEKLEKVKSIPRPVSAKRPSRNLRHQESEAPIKLAHKKTQEESKKYTELAVLNTAPGMPVVGNVQIRYGQTDDIGAKSQGLTIATSNNALVTAPFSGTIKFAGAFKRYGQIILIDHGGDYFSLIGGVDKILVLAGKNVGAGEPLAKMSDAQENNVTNLYYEVRYKGKPVNPKRLLSARNL